VRGELWEEIDGEMLLYGKAFGTSANNNVAGYAGFGMITSGSPSTGIHANEFRITKPDTAPPASPTLAIGEGRRSYLQIQKSPDTVYTKIYRSDDGGVSYSLAGFTTDAIFTDDEPALGSTVLYKATSLDANWNVSSESDVLTVTYASYAFDLNHNPSLNEARGDGLTADSFVSANNESLRDGAGANNLVQSPPGTGVSTATAAVNGDKSFAPSDGTLGAISPETPNRAAPATETATDTTNRSQDALIAWLLQAHSRPNNAGSDTLTSDVDGMMNTRGTYLESTDLAFAGLGDFGSATRGL
jgi:hypothetical protein